MVSITDSCDPPFCLRVEEPVALRATDGPWEPITEGPSRAASLQCHRCATRGLRLPLHGLPIPVRFGVRCCRRVCCHRIRPERHASADPTRSRQRDGQPSCGVSRLRGLDLRRVETGRHRARRDGRRSWRHLRRYVLDSAYHPLLDAKRTTLDRVSRGRDRPPDPAVLTGGRSSWLLPPSVAVSDGSMTRFRWNTPGMAER